MIGELRAECMTNQSSDRAELERRLAQVRRVLLVTSDTVTRDRLQHAAAKIVANDKAAAISNNSSLLLGDLGI